MRSRFRLAVFLGLLFAQFATVAVLALVGERLGAAADANHATALLDAEAAEAADRVRAHLGPAEWVVASTSSLAAQPSVSSDDFTEMFVEALDRIPQLAGVYIGRPNGEFLYASRTDDGLRIKTIDVGPDGRTTELQFRDGSGGMSEATTDPDDTYDPTTRPWYHAALEQPGQVAWAEPYVFFTSRELGVTASRTIERDGEVLGVVGADIELASLSAFLATLRVGDDGGTVVFNQDGTIIAHPDPALIHDIVDGEPVPVSITELDDPYARAAIGALIEGGPAAGTEGFDSDLGDSFVSSRRLPVGGGTWTIAVFAPDDDLIGGLVDARARERWLILAVGALTVLMVAILALPATRPIGDLESWASTDSLTGLANRRTTLANVARIAASSKPSAAAMFDLDHFKLVNDTYGHQVGDEVLGSVAIRMVAAAPASARIGRIGGEEFLVTLDDVPAHEAQAVIERIRVAIGNGPVATSSAQVELTASVGVATAAASCTVDQLLATADAALLEAKHRGRDQLVVGAAGPTEAEVYERRLMSTAD